MLIGETESNAASSFAVRACVTPSIWSAMDVGVILPQGIRFPWRPEVGSVSL